jgi:hypothetical protein
MPYRSSMTICFFAVGQPGVCHPPGVIAQFGRIAIPEAMLEHVVVKVAVDQPVA